MNMGIFTKNAKINIIVNFILKQVEYENRILELYFIIKILNNKGKDAITVYIIKYIPACKRSGWLPYLVIINKVGIRIISNIM